MQAVVITEPGGPEVLKLQELAAPVPQRGEVRVRVHATAVNRADVLQRQGRYPAPADVPSNVPGLEYAGEIDMLGEGVSDLKVGDRVFGLVGGGSYAEFVITHSRALARMPANLSFAQAAALPEACITAYDAMVTQCGSAAGETVLINAVGSGVGTAAVQIARAIGLRTIGTSRDQEKLSRASELGLDCGILVEGATFADQVLALTNNRGVDLVLELNGGNYVAESLRSLSPGGRIIIVGLVAGARVELDLARVLSRRLLLRGTTLRARPLEEKIQVAQTLAKNLVPLIEASLIRPVIDCTFSLSAVAEAHSYMEANRNFGKIVLTVA